MPDVKTLLIILGILIVLTVPIVLLTDNVESKDNYSIKVVHIGPLAMLLWEAQEGGDVYEVAGRMFDGEWSTILIVGAERARVQVPLGIASYRVRPWTTEGPGRWSEPSEFIIRQVMPPEPPRQDPRTLSEK